jgi:hypothetical protein
MTLYLPSWTPQELRQPGIASSAALRLSAVSIKCGTHRTSVGSAASSLGGLKVAESKTAKTLQRPPILSKLQFRMKFRTSAITVALALVANALISVAYADERLSGIQTELTDTTISGYVNASADVGTTVPSDFSVADSISAVPEPSSIVLFAMGAVGFIIFTRSNRVRFMRTCRAKMF